METGSTTMRQKSLRWAELGRNCQWMLVGIDLMRNKMPNLETLSHKILISYKEENSKFNMNKPT